jgi:CheY-like chemotaxis protein
VVHNIIKEHEGAILVDSVVGQGTMVKCFFPGMMIETQEHAVRVEEAPMGAGERILYVEDEPLLARVGVRRLAALGYNVTVFNDSFEALKRIQLASEPFDLMLTDYWMPGMTGLDLAREIHRIRPALPIILLTGFLEELPPETLHACGIRKVLNKPATRHDLAAAVHEALQPE